MNLRKDIGGFFEIELNEGDFLHGDSILLNSGRSCFEYTLRVKNPSKVYLPKFTCDAMTEPLKKLGIEYVFYKINDQLEIRDEIKIDKSDLIVYTNYFGIKDEYSREVSKKYGSSLILDSSQAFFFNPLFEGSTFYSPRKFLGVSDGGCLYTTDTLDTSLPIDTSSARVGYLFKRLEQGAEAAYSDFKTNDNSLSGEPIKYMSQTTRRILASVNFEKVRNTRKDNARYLHSQLKDLNRLHIDIDDLQAPMVYPLLIEKDGLREGLINNKIFVAQYWPNVLEWCEESELEYYLSANILPLPIDQRYTLQDMQHIIHTIKGAL